MYVPATDLNHSCIKITSLSGKNISLRIKFMLEFLKEVVEFFDNILTFIFGIIIRIIGWSIAIGCFVLLFYVIKGVFYD